MKPSIRLSQCMIVKNEEKNIRRALSWGNEIVSEQIVVDTGSTDQTVAIAEEMGAKVYHFDWNDDFSAAKNYAIEQAKGDWIAFLDADEYLNEEGVETLYNILSSLRAKSKAQRPSLIRSMILNLDDSGKVFASALQDRFFCNNLHIRYKNKIHEMLFRNDSGSFTVQDESHRLSVYHTGYAPAAYAETNKLQRNIRMLQKELEEHPNDGDTWSYLGDSFLAEGLLGEAEEAYKKTLAIPAASMMPERRTPAYANLLRCYMSRADKEEDILELYAEFEQTQYNCPDVEYWMGVWRLNQKREREAVVWLEKALQRLEEFTGGETLVISGRLKDVYTQLMQIYNKQGDKGKAVRYSMLCLRLDCFSDAAAETLLSLLKDEPGEEKGADATFGLLSKLYRFDELKDKLYILKTARKTGFLSLDNRMLRLLSKDEQLWLLGFPQSTYRLTKEEFENRYPQIKCDNETDMAFLTLMEEITCKSELQIKQDIREKLQIFEKEQKQNYDTFTAYYNSVPLWGRLYPQQQNYEAIDARARVLKEHRDEFIWLYNNLEDYRSKQSLYAIMKNWLYIDINLLDQIREKGSPYYDTDIIPSVKDGIFVSLGSDKGDTILDFIKTYGEVYKHIYCYAARPQSAEALRTKFEIFETITVCEKASGSGTGTAYLSDKGILTTNTTNIMDLHRGLPVDMVSIDEDIQEPLTFIKVDIIGLVQETLLGCRRHITEEHPRLAVSVCYGYEDIWKIPGMIRDMDPSYRFYIRYYGGNLIPTRFVLYAV